jgi:type I restriction enzyme R subunit
VLRHGIKHGAHHVDLLYGTPLPGNAKAAERYAANRFSVTPQLRYSLDETQRALDVGLFINGLSVATFEVKTASPSRQSRTVSSSTSATAIRARSCSRSDAASCTSLSTSTKWASAHLAGKGSWFVPFDQG